MPLPAAGRGIGRRSRAAAALAWFLVLLGAPGRATALDGAACPSIDAAEPTPPPKKSVTALVVETVWSEAKMYGRDTAALFLAPFHWKDGDFAAAGGAVALTAGAFAADSAVYDAAQRNRSHFTNEVSRATTRLGEAPAIVVSMGLIASGIAAGDADVRDMGRDALETSVITGFFTNFVIKPAAGRFRPKESNGETRFQPFSSHHSFTSGHATEAFSVASVVAMRSPGWIIPTVAYGLASLVAFDRINDREHFASDVVAGALFATATGRFLVRRHRAQAKPFPATDESSELSLEAVPIKDGVALRARW